ncbi:MAG: malectin domain-containing carbohydrate-binding protein [Opitutaceae bacterium]|nr:malectin domain-containing carbohydrate-binding protein [Opitutaceae bacterium]
MMLTSLIRSARGLATLALLGAVLTAKAATIYMTPSGAGSQNGSSWSNALPQSQIQSTVNNLQPGDTLSLGSGTYTFSSLSISGSGTAGNPKSIVGVNTGSGIPVLQGTFNVANSAGGVSFISFPGAASYWEIKNLSIRNQPFAINLPLNGTTYTLRNNLLFENLSFDSIEDGIRIYNSSNITVRNCTVVRHTKKGFRISQYSRFITFIGCSTDCTGGDSSFPARAIPTGFFGDDTSGAAIIHDLQFIDCIARNNRFAQSSTAYWNGDGFSTESGTYNVTFTRCKSYDNDDGGFDNKADNLTYEHCVAAGNKRAYRQWGNNGQMFNSIAVNGVQFGGTGGIAGLWVSQYGADIDVSFSTFHDTGTGVDAEPGSSVTVSDSILSTTSSSTPFTAGSPTLVATATYRPGSGTNPNYLSASAGWRGSPANAYDSQTYNQTKGYHSSRSTGSDAQAPSVPSGLAASNIASTSFTLSWTASTDNVAVTGYEVLRNGTVVSSPTTTSVTVTGLSSSTTYSMQVRARDAAGNWSAPSSALSVTTSGTNTPVRIESGSTSSFTDSSGNVWAADNGSTGGSIVDRGAIAIANTTEDRVYQTERWGVTGYAIPVPNGLYTVTLHFAETYSGITAAGQRVFSVAAEGSTPSGWGSIDVFAQAGGRDRALLKTATVNVTDGTLNLAFTASANNTIINGIEVVLSGTSDTTPPSVPSGLSASGITSSSFTLAWGASSDNVGVTGYEVRRDGTVIATPTTTSLSVTGLSAGTTYAMQVRARDAASNWSALSSTLNVTTSGSSSVKLSVPASSIAASGTPEGIPNLIDNNLSTDWQDNANPWLRLNLGATRTVKYVKIAWKNGSTIRYNFELQVGNSASGPWTTVYPNGQSAGNTTSLETYDFTDTNASFVRFVGNGNNGATGSDFSRITEIEVWGN